MLKKIIKTSLFIFLSLVVLIFLLLIFSYLSKQHKNYLLVKAYEKINIPSDWRIKDQKILPGSWKDCTIQYVDQSCPTVKTTYIPQANAMESGVATMATTLKNLGYKVDYCKKGLQKCDHSYINSSNSQYKVRILTDPQYVYLEMEASQ